MEYKVRTESNISTESNEAICVTSFYCYDMFMIQTEGHQSGKLLPTHPSLQLELAGRGSSTMYYLVAVDYACYFTFLYKFHDSFSILATWYHFFFPASFDWREGWVGRIVPLCFDFVPIKQILQQQCCHTDSLVMSSRTVAVCSSFSSSFLSSSSSQE